MSRLSKAIASRRTRRILPVLVLSLLAGLCVAQNQFGGRGWGGRRGGWGRETGPMIRTEGGDMVNEDTVRTAREVASHSTGTPNWTNSAGFEKDVFTFARILYKFDHDRGPAWLAWINDFPDSDLNLSFRLQQLTSLKTDPDGRVIRLGSPELLDYPFIYIVKPGRLELRDEEVPLLRKYLLNGGALMADDFWGDREWASFEHAIRRVLPERNWTEVPIEHPLFHTVFDLKTTKQDLQVPNIHAYENGGRTSSRTWRDAQEIHIRAWFDDKHRIMVIATHNTDNGDGWEREGEDDEYFHKFSERRAYPIAINIVFYLMTH